MGIFPGCRRASAPPCRANLAEPRRCGKRLASSFRRHAGRSSALAVQACPAQRLGERAAPARQVPPVAALSCREPPDSLRPRRASCACSPAGETPRCGCRDGNHGQLIFLLPEAKAHRENPVGFFDKRSVACEIASNRAPHHVAPSHLWNCQIECLWRQAYHFGTATSCPQVKDERPAQNGRPTAAVDPLRK